MGLGDQYKQGGRQWIKVKIRQELKFKKTYAKNVPKVKADPSFPALGDFPPDLFYGVGHIPQAYWITSAKAREGTLRPCQNKEPTRRLG